MNIDENLIVELVARGVVTERFRRLPPDKKTRTYKTAIRLFSKYGYDGLAVDHLCREASISKGSFFQYFPSKMNLLEFSILIFDDYLDRWINEIKAAEKAVLAGERLLYLYQSLVINSKLFKDEQKFYLFVTNALYHSGVSLEGIDLRRHIQGYVTEIITRGVETGEIRSDYKVGMTGHLVSLIIGALVERRYRGQRLTRHELEDYLISFLFDGIKA